MTLFLEHARSAPIYGTLCALPASEDGNLLERTDDRTAESQAEFLRWALHLAAPKVVLETGTNKALFMYFLSLVCREVTLYTFDCDVSAAKAVSLVNQHQRHVLGIFQPGDTRQTLRRFHGAIDFAWIDGGHDFAVSLSDLIQCYRLRIPFVAVDDVAMASVRSAVNYLLTHAPYAVVPNPFARHDRRGALLLKLNESS